MALKDPPNYVGLDPALIYEVHDLKRETYQRLLQLIGWMWVTRKKGCPLGTSAQELAEKWKISERSAYHTLQTLAAKGYIEVEYQDGRAYITKSEQFKACNMPGEPAHTQQAARGGTQHAGGAGTQQIARGDDNRPREAAHNTPGEPASSDRVRASSLHGHAIRLHDPNSISSRVVVGSTDEDQDLEQQQPTSKSAVQLSMEEGGMFADRARELAGDPWVTEDRVSRWLVQLLGDQRIRSVGAVLYANLKAHREPPALQREDPQRFLEGEYAEFIEH